VETEADDTGKTSPSANRQVATMLECCQMLRLGSEIYQTLSMAGLHVLTTLAL